MTHDELVGDLGGHETEEDDEDDGVLRVEVRLRVHGDVDPGAHHGADMQAGRYHRGALQRRIKSRRVK